MSFFSVPPPSCPPPPHLSAKFLVVPPHFVGDAILTVPLLRQIKRQRPQATIGLVVSGAAYTLLNECPYVDHLYRLDQPQALVWQAIKSCRYDQAVLLRPSLSDARRAQQADIPQRIGYRQQRVIGSFTANQGWGLTQALDTPALDTTVHQVRHLMDEFLPLMGLAVLPGDDLLELWPTATDRQAVEPYFDTAHRRVAVLHWAAASLNKGVALATVIPVLLDLANRGFRLLLSGPPEMAAVYDSAFQAVLNQAGADWRNLAGKTSLPQLLAVLERSHVLVSLDSAPVHMAAAVGTPAIVTVYGATNADRWAPWVGRPSVRSEPVYLSLPCRPCRARVCDHNQCRTDVTSQHLLQALNRVLV